MSGRRPPPRMGHTPASFRTQVLAQFCSRQNLEYLRGVFATRVPAGAARRFALDTLEPAARVFASGEGRAHDVLQSDEHARRGIAATLWSEVRRLNTAFFTDRLAFLEDQAHLFSGPATDEFDEPYHMRAFTADSLRPPGLEGLNSAATTRATMRPPARAGRVTDEVFMYGDDDAPWDNANPERCAEQALAEYWGESLAPSTVRVRECDGEAYGTVEDGYGEAGSTTRMRVRGIPLWQKGGREGIARDIGETLGSSGLELEYRSYGWDMGKLRDPYGRR